MSSPTLKRSKTSWTAEQITSLLTLRYKDSDFFQSFKSAKSNADRHANSERLTERFNREQGTQFTIHQVTCKLSNLRRDHDRLSSMLQVQYHDLHY